MVNGDPVSNDEAPESTQSRTRDKQIIEIAAIVLSVLALFVSVRGCRVAEKALELSAREYDSERLVVYQGVFDRVKNEITFAAIDSGIRLQSGRVYFPPQVDTTVWPLSPPRYSLPLEVLKVELENQVSELVPKVEGSYQVLDSSSVPMVIQSTYAARGQAYEEQGLYQIHFKAVVNDNPTSTPSIFFDGVTFLGRIAVDQDPATYLQDMWAAGIARAMEDPK